MELFLSKIQELKSSEIAKTIEQRKLEFQQTWEDDYAVFSELCFCLTTANSSAEMGIKVQKALYGRIHSLAQEELSRKLRNLGYRFYNKRAEYIHKAKKWSKIKKIIKAGNWKHETEIREWLVDNILGLGYKEASHFLRNIGFMNIAILDRHIIRIMYENGMINELPKTLNRKKYLEYEKKLEELCSKSALSQGELDLYLWYMKTGKILK